MRGPWTWRDSVYPRVQDAEAGFGKGGLLLHADLPRGLPIGRAWGCAEGMSSKWNVQKNGHKSQFDEKKARQIRISLVTV